MTRLNFTGRKRIPRERVKLRLHVQNDIALVDLLNLDLSSAKLPESADIVLEAYRAPINMRFAAGTVGEPILPSGLALQEFDSPEGVQFRIKVIGRRDNDGRLLAVADKLQAELASGETPHRSLLPARPADLGGILWRLEIEQDEPELLVNRELGDWRSLVATPEFTALVMPEVLRQVAFWMLQQEGVDIDDDTVAASWLQFFLDIGYDPRNVDNDEQEGFVEDALNHFARRHQFREMVRHLTGDLES